MVRFTVDVDDNYINAGDIERAIRSYLGLGANAVFVEHDTGTRDSQAPDRRQSTRRIHDSAKARLKK